MDADFEDAVSIAGPVCVIGVFDGVHRGHRFIIDEAKQDAATRGVPCQIVTFSVDPDELFCAEGLRKIMSNEQRLEALAATGVDDVRVLPFTRTFAALSPAAFLDDVLGEQAPSAIHVGCDFRFGAQAAGTVADMSAWAAAHGAAFVGHDLMEQDGSPVTSTRIRALLGQGDVEGASALLGHPYSIAGDVIHGREAGREMGIRTANLYLPPSLRVLRDGVYAAYAQVEGQRYKAAVSVGLPPTFIDEAESNMEAHLLDFDGDLYGKRITLELVHRLRDMRKFDDTSDLIAAIEGDIAWVRANL